METAAMIWFIGGMISVVASLVFIARPEGRKHGGVVLLHLGIQIMLITILWPLLTVAFFAIQIEEWRSHRNV